MTTTPATNIVINSAADTASALLQYLIFSVVGADN